MYQFRAAKAHSKEADPGTGQPRFLAMKNTPQNPQATSPVLARPAGSTSRKSCTRLLAARRCGTRVQARRGLRDAQAAHGADGKRSAFAKISALGNAQPPAGHYTEVSRRSGFQPDV